MTRLCANYLAGTYHTALSKQRRIKSLLAKKILSTVPRLQDNQKANNYGAGQAAQMRRLFCVFVIRMQ